MAQPGQYSYYPMQNVETTGPSATVDLTGLVLEGAPVAEVMISDTATVDIECSLDQVVWVPVATTDVSDIYVLDPRGQYYRFNVTSYGNGTVTVLVGTGMMEDGRMCGVRPPPYASGGLAGPQFSAIPGVSGGGGSGTIQLIETTAPITGGPITTSGTIAIDEFAGGDPGAVPTSAGGTTNFLRADGSWEEPPGLSVGELTTIAYSQIVDSTPITNTTSETFFSKSYTIPERTLQIGDVIRVKALVTVTGITLTPSLIVRLYIGDTPVCAVNALATIGRLQVYEVECVVRSVSDAGDGVFEILSYNNDSDNFGLYPDVAFASDAAQQIRLSAQWSSASASNTVISRILNVEVKKSGSST